MSEKITIRAGVIGLGRIAWELEMDSLREKPATHIGALRALDAVELVGAWDGDPEACKKFSGSKYSRGPWPWSPRIPTNFSSAQDFLAQVKPDLVCIATWADSHEEMVSLCVEAGVKVVVCEKPLALDRQGAQRIAQMEGTGPGKTRILVNHERRTALDWVWLKDQVARETLGPVLSIRGRLYLGAQRKPALTLLHDGTHLIDILRFLTQGEWRGHSALGNPLSPGGTVVYTGWFGDTPGVLEIGSGRDHMVFEVEVNTSRGRFVMGNGLSLAWESAPAPWAKGFRSLRTLKTPRFKKTRYFQNLMAEAVECCRHRERIPSSGAGDGLATLVAVEELLSLSGLSLDDLKGESPEENKPEG